MQIFSRRHDKVTISHEISIVQTRDSLRYSVLREIQENRTSHVMVNHSAVRLFFRR